jgi:3-methyladenine DNA glycosylase Tag
MQKFSNIFQRAAKRHGGEDGVRAKLNDNRIQHATPPLSDDRWLSQFTKRIFQAGFNWQVVENKWEGFERAFWGFDIDRCRRIDFDDVEALTSNTDIVRNPVKIKTVSKNADMIATMSEKAGSADKFIRDWPADDFIGLLEYLNKNGSHLGANTASYALRFSDVPSFILSKDVTAALITAGVIDKPATSKTAKKAVQEAFNQWSSESGEDATTISRVLALSIDG